MANLFENIQGDISKLGEIAKISSGGTPDRKNENYYVGGTIPWIKTGEINYKTIVDSEEKITQDGLNNSSAKMFPVGTLLMAMYGQGVTRGRVAMLGIEASTNQACAAINSLTNEILNEYLFYFLTYKYEEIRNFAHGANQQNLSLTLIKEIQVKIPPVIKQKLIIETLSALDNKINLINNLRKIYSYLLDSLLNKLMNQEIDVSNLEFENV